MPNHHRVEVRSIDGLVALVLGSMSGLQRGSWQLSVTKIGGSFVRRQSRRLGGFNGAIQFENLRVARGHAEILNFYRFGFNYGTMAVDSWYVAFAPDLRTSVLLYASEKLLFLLDDSH
jgi:hypothetical protein